MKILMCGFGNPDNRGCEAIVRSISEMVKKRFPDSHLTALSNDYGRVQMPDIKTIDKYGKTWYPRAGEISNYVYIALNKFFKNAMPLCDLLNAKSYADNKDIDLCISVGGDNFCYNRTIDHLTVHHKHYYKKGAVMVHWGTSFEENLMTPKLIKDLKRFDLIFVRESLSYETLLKSGFEKTARLVPDPAFYMGKSDTHGISIPEGAIGLNVSPMVEAKESKKGIIFENTINLINYITDVQGKNVFFIPHVCDRKTGEGDWSMMKKILGAVSSPDKCTLVDHTYTAPEYKDIISKMDVFIGARTHSTIAAYSTCVPTLTIGYSVKSLGIAKDLFGTNKNYVIPTQSLKGENDLTEGYKWLYDNKESIRAHLEDIMPEYIKKADTVTKEIYEICKKGRKNNA